MKTSFQKIGEASSDAALIFLTHHEVKYSIYTLLSSLEKRQLFKDINIYLARFSSPKMLLQDHITFDLLDKIHRAVEKHERVTVALSLMTTSLYEHLYLVPRLIKLKRRHGNLTLIAGGPHATGDPLGTLKLGFNLAFIGEAEETLPKYIESSMLSHEDTSSIDGVAYLEDDKLKLRKPRKVKNLNNYPAFPMVIKGFKAIEITRGCPHGCGFCQVSSMFGREMRHRSVENVVEHVKLMLRHGRKDIRFITPNCLCYGASKPGEMRLDLIEELLAKLHQLTAPRGGRVFFGSFPSEMRPEYVTKEAARILSKYSSSRSVVVGAQSGSDRVLKLMNRGHTTEDILNAVEILRRAGLDVDVDFIFGLPFEEEEDAEQTAKLMEKLLKLGAAIHAHYFIPLPGTAMANLEPKPIHIKVLKVLSKHIGLGKVYGHWQSQMAIAQRILELRKRRIIVSPPPASS